MAEHEIPDSYFDASKVMGPFLLGMTANAVVSGVVLAQAARYFSASAGRDASAHPVVLGLVVLLVIFVLMVVAGNIAMVWPQLVGRQPIVAFLTLSPAFRVADFATCSGIAACQGYFGYRLYVVSRSRLLAGAVMLLALADFVFATTVLGIGERLTPLPGQSTLPGLDTLNHYGEVVFSISLFNDLLLASTLTYFLLKQRAGHVVSVQTDTILTRLSTLTLTNAAITIPLQVGVIISYHVLTKTTNLVVFFFEALLLPTFALCAIFTLNQRSAIREAASEASGSGHGRFTMPSFISSRPSQRGAGADAARQFDLGQSMVRSISETSEKFGGASTEKRFVLDVDRPPRTAATDELELVSRV